MTSLIPRADDGVAANTSGADDAQYHDGPARHLTGGRLGRRDFDGIRARLPALWRLAGGGSVHRLLPLPAQFADNFENPIYLRLDNVRLNERPVQRHKPFRPGGG